MRSIYEDVALRQALHSIYLALFRAMKACRSGFTKADATRMLTGLMAARPWSWRVVGITPAALDLLGQHNFKRPPRPSCREATWWTVQRRHTFSSTATLQEFFDVFLERDKTVIMTNAENAHSPGKPVPEVHRR